MTLRGKYFLILMQYFHIRNISVLDCSYSQYVNAQSIVFFLKPAPHEMCNILSCVITLCRCLHRLILFHEKRMIGVSYRHHMPNAEIRKRLKVADIVHRTCRLRWNWAGYIGRVKDNRWKFRIREWRPRSHERWDGFTTRKSLQTYIMCE